MYLLLQFGERYKLPQDFSLNLSLGFSSALWRLDTTRLLSTRFPASEECWTLSTEEEETVSFHQGWTTHKEVSHLLPIPPLSSGRWKLCSSWAHPSYSACAQTNYCCDSRLAYSKEHFSSFHYHEHQLPASLQRRATRKNSDHLLSSSRLGKPFRMCQEGF